jgi:succinate dehydrogenase / fumarate reductase membrane anchor subunit
MSIGTRRLLVGAHYGLRDWLIQRISALVILAFVLVLGLGVLLHGPMGHAEWKALFAPVPVKLLTLLAVLAICYHAWIGVRDIWMDYVSNPGIRLCLHVATVIWLLYCFAWAAQILWAGAAA